MQYELYSHHPREEVLLFYAETENQVQAGLLLLNVNGPRDLLCVESGITLL